MSYHRIADNHRSIALGFDGVFLDTLYNDGAWGPRGLAAGLAGVAAYRNRQKNFAKAIFVRGSLSNRKVTLEQCTGCLAADELKTVASKLGAAAECEAALGKSRHPAMSARRSSRVQILACPVSY